MKQFEFVLDYKEAHELENILLQELPKFNVEIIPKGGARSKTRPIDFAEYDFLENGEKIGNYQFELQQNKYFVNLDLTGMNNEIYKLLMDSVQYLIPVQNIK